MSTTKKIEMAMIRAIIEEDREVTMARFVAGFNQDIQEIFDLQHYVEIEDLVQKAKKVEKQLRSRKSKASSSSNGRPNWSENRIYDRREDKATPRSKECEKNKVPVIKVSLKKDRDAFQIL